MSVGSPRGAHQIRIRFRSRVVAWVLAPLVMCGLAVWFLFNFAVCMGGYAAPWQLRLCRWFNVLPDLLGLLLAVGLVSLVVALLAFGRLTGSADVMARRSYLMRPAVGTRHAYGRLDEVDKSPVWFAAEMTVLTLLITLATLVYFWFELAFPLALVVIGGLVIVLVRLGRRGVDRMRRSPRRDPTGDEPIERADAPSAGSVWPYVRLILLGRSRTPRTPE